MKKDLKVRKETAVAKVYKLLEVDADIMDDEEIEQCSHAVIEELPIKYVNERLKELGLDTQTLIDRIEQHARDIRRTGVVEKLDTLLEMDEIENLSTQDVEERLNESGTETNQLLENVLNLARENAQQPKDDPFLQEKERHELMPEASGCQPDGKVVNFPCGTARCSWKGGSPGGKKSLLSTFLTLGALGTIATLLVAVYILHPQFVSSSQPPIGYEIFYTIGEYDQFAYATGRQLLADQGWDRGWQPVINVSWNDAAVQKSTKEATMSAPNSERVSVAETYDITRATPTADGTTIGGMPTQEEVIPKQEPPSIKDNPTSYVVFGKRHDVMNSSESYRQRGIASWYGPGFHGRKTSSGTIYNMYGISAAHKYLPTPTYARMTPLDNGRSIIVQIDDRGPFVGGRPIDLSYGVAVKLGMMEEGTAPVEIEALPPYQYLPGFEPGQMLASADASHAPTFTYKPSALESDLNKAFIAPPARSVSPVALASFNQPGHGDNNPSAAVVAPAAKVVSTEPTVAAITPPAGMNNRAMTSPSVSSPAPTFNSLSRPVEPVAQARPIKSDEESDTPVHPKESRKSRRPAPNIAANRAKAERLAADNPEPKAARTAKKVATVDKGAIRARATAAITPEKSTVTAKSPANEHLAAVTTAKPAVKAAYKGQADKGQVGNHAMTVADTSHPYLLVDACAQRGNAEKLRNRLIKALPYSVRIDPGRNNLPTVQVEPLNDPIETSRLKVRPANFGISEAHIASDIQQQHGPASFAEPSTTTIRR